MSAIADRIELLAGRCKVWPVGEDENIRNVCAATIELLDLDKKVDNNFQASVESRRFLRLKTNTILSKTF